MKKNSRKKRFFGLWIGLCCLFLLVGCRKEEEETVAESHPIADESEEDKVYIYEQEFPELQNGQIQSNMENFKLLNLAPTVRIGARTGMNALGLGFLLEANDNITLGQHYEVAFCESDQSLVQSLEAGDVDFAFLAPMKAMQLINERGMNLKIAGISSYSNLACVTGDFSMALITDLQGRCIYMTGQGTAQEAAVRYLFSLYNLSEVNLNFVYSEQEVLEKLQEDPENVGILDIADGYAFCKTNIRYSMPLCLAKCWNSAPTAHGSKMINGLVVVRGEFLDAYPDSVKLFLEEYAKSVSTIDGNYLHGSELMHQYGILPEEAYTSEILEYHETAAVWGTDMMQSLKRYYEAIYSVDPALFGSQLPGDNLYYLLPIE